MEKKIDLVSFVDLITLARKAAGDWLDEVKLASQRGEPHCVALSGGRIARCFFETVAELVRARGTTFEHVHFFWGDERCVPPTDEESNFAWAQKYLLRGISVPAENVHRIRGEENPAKAAKLAEAELRRHVAVNESNQPALDIIFLGMGEDGHVASLFPGEPEAVRSGKAIYRAVIGPKPPPNRVTMGYSTIAAAKQVWALVSGEGKQQAWRESILPDGRTPLARVIQMRTSTKLFSDLCV